MHCQLIVHRLLVTQGTWRVFDTYECLVSERWLLICGSMLRNKDDICSHAYVWCYVCCLWFQVVTYSWSLCLKLSVAHQTAAWCCHVRWQILTIRGRIRSCGQSNLNWHLVTRMELKLTLYPPWTEPFRSTGRHAVIPNNDNGAVSLDLFNYYRLVYKIVIFLYVLSFENKLCSLSPDLNKSIGDNFTKWQYMQYIFLPLKIQHGNHHFINFHWAIMFFT